MAINGNCCFLSVPVVITIPLVNLTVTVGSQAFLPCEVYGDPAPNVTWDKGRKKANTCICDCCMLYCCCMSHSEHFTSFITACNR